MAGERDHDQQRQRAGDASTTNGSHDDLRAWAANEREDGPKAAGHSRDRFECQSETGEEPLVNEREVQENPRRL
jgi:hypothetical protein